MATAECESTAVSAPNKEQAGLATVDAATATC